MSRDPRLRELGAFLRARRGEVAPAAEPGGPGEGRRQVAGLRREEVAALVHVTPEYYTRIEQGRMAPARDLVRRMAEALGLDGGQLRYALALLDEADGASPPESPAVEGALSRLLSRFTDVPAIVIGPGTSIVWWNCAAAEWFLDFARIPDAERTFTRMMFSEPEFEDRFCDLSSMRETVVGILRSGAPSVLNAGGEVALPPDLLGIPDFRAIWERHDVTQPRGAIEVGIRHPVRGDLCVDLIALSVADDPAHRVLFFCDR